MYDIIGDIHGHADQLSALLARLGYEKRGGAWRRPSALHRILFVGDYIDRGPEIRAATEIVRELVDADIAVAVMGNHEYNAVAWHALGPEGFPLRAHTAAHLRQHERTLRAFNSELSDLLRWMRRLPLFFENDDVRVVHATWDDRSIASLDGATPLTDDRFLERSAVRGTREHAAIATLLKGAETDLPPGRFYYDKEGTRRYTTRTRWWIRPPAGGTVPLGSIAMPPADTQMETVSVPAAALNLPGYEDPRPVFVGHYWLTGSPAPLSDRVACVDYSVANGGALCAYRYSGELPLRAERFVCVPV
ncbi:MAG: metallophosphoesterase [Spirochaeta sp.]|nr:metallophosphoesterase [Spirochaeta sp.]